MLLKPPYELFFSMFDIITQILELYNENKDENVLASSFHFIKALIIITYHNFTLCIATKMIMQTFTILPHPYILYSLMGAYIKNMSYNVV